MKVINIINNLILSVNLIWSTGCNEPVSWSTQLYYGQVNDKKKLLYFIILNKFAAFLCVFGGFDIKWI